MSLRAHSASLPAFLLAFLFLATLTSGCANTGRGAAINSADNIYNPTAWAEVLPAYYSDSPADHTYIKTMRKDGTSESWPLPKNVQEPKAVKESPPHPEVAIYRKYLPEARQAKSRQAYQAVYQSYIDELLEYHIADRLGRDWSRKTCGVSF